MHNESTKYTLTSLTRLEAEKIFKSRNRRHQLRDVRNRVEKIRDMMFDFSYKNRIYTNKSINFNSKGEFSLPDKKWNFDHTSKIKESEDLHLSMTNTKIMINYYGIESIKSRFTNTVKKYIDDYKFNKLKVLARTPYKPKRRTYKSKNNIEFIL